MFIHYRTQGFILKKEERGEADQLFTIYTKDFGKLEILGKAVRKISSKLRSGAEIFNLSEIEFIQAKAHKTLTDAILIEKFESLRKDVKKVKIAYKISEISDNLIKAPEPEPKIWDLLNETFEKLNNYSLATLNYLLIYYYFLWNLLSILGYEPELYSCFICQGKIKPADIFFSQKEGGLICGQCQKSKKSEKKISPETVKIIRILLKKDWSILKRLKIEKEDLQHLKDISDYYLTEVLRQIE